MNAFSENTLINTQEHASYAIARQLCSNLPQTLCHRPAKWHPNWPPPLRTHQVFAHLSTIFRRQILQPIANRLNATICLEEDQRRLSWGYFSQDSPWLVCTTKGALSQAAGAALRLGLCWQAGVTALCRPTFDISGKRRA